MKRQLSELIEELIDLKMEGEPKPADWVSFEELERRRQDYYQRIAFVKCGIDIVTEGTQNE